MHVGLIGTGFGLRVHLPGYQRVTGVEIVAVCSARRERAEQVAREHSIDFATDDYHELLGRADVEVVDITTPPDSHAEMALAATAAGKHVICEKPMAMNAAQAAGMTRRAGESSKLHIIDHEQRFTPARRHL